MADTNTKDPVLVVVQLSGGNDYLNTIIPYNNGLYQDYRPNIGIPQEDVIPIDDELGFNPNLAPLKEKFWDTGKMALVHGVGFESCNRSHFRSMDVWHTAEPDKMGTEGWLGRAIREIDPQAENVLTGVSFGPGLPGAMALPGVPVASVMELERYGVLTGITPQRERDQALEIFARMYGPTVGTGYVMDYLSQTGSDILKGADILKTAPAGYSSTIEYSNSPIGQSLRGAAQVHLADMGARVIYTEVGNFDTHANELAMHEPLWQDLSASLVDFYDDLKEHQRQRQRGYASLHRVRTTLQGQRHRHGPRHRGRGHRNRRSREGRFLQRVPLNSGGQTPGRRLAIQLRLPGTLLHRS